MITSRRHVGFTPTELPSPSTPLPFVAELPGGWEGWLRRAKVVSGTPFLLSPRLSAFIRDHIGIDGHYAFHLPDLGGNRPLRDPDSADDD